MLTTIESYLVLDRTVSAIEARWPNLPVLSKHDSIMSSEHSLYIGNNNGTIDQVHDLILQTLEDIVGLRPTIKVTRY